MYLVHLLSGSCIPLQKLLVTPAGVSIYILHSSEKDLLTLNCVT